MFCFSPTNTLTTLLFQELLKSGQQRTNLTNRTLGNRGTADPAGAMAALPIQISLVTKSYLRCCHVVFRLHLDVSAHLCFILIISLSFQFCIFFICEVLFLLTFNCFQSRMLDVWAVLCLMFCLFLHVFLCIFCQFYVCTFHSISFKSDHLLFAYWVHSLHTIWDLCLFSPALLTIFWNVLYST